VRRATLILFACLSLALAAAAAGCGGGGGDSSSSSSSSSSDQPLTKSELITKADGICSEANKNVPTPPSDLMNFNPTTATTEKLKEFGDYLEKVVEHFRGELEDLQKLKPPEEIADDYDKAMANLEESLNELDEAGEAARNGDRQKLLSKLEESDKHSTEANKLAKKIGLKVCGT
jgi:uncharacterized protein YicC (UPF0701 family)